MSRIVPFNFLHPEFKDLVELFDDQCILEELFKYFANSFTKLREKQKKPWYFHTEPPLENNINSHTMIIPIIFNINSYQITEPLTTVSYLTHVYCFDIFL
jgi:hypothetical protein